MRRGPSLATRQGPPRGHTASTAWRRRMMSSHVRLNAEHQAARGDDVHRPGLHDGLAAARGGRNRHAPRAAHQPHGSTCVGPEVVGWTGLRTVLKFVVTMPRRHIRRILHATIQRAHALYEIVMRVRFASRYQLATSIFHIRTSPYSTRVSVWRASTWERINAHACL